MLRVVVDPGVLIAALLSREGAPAKLLLSWRAGDFDLVLSPKLLAELGRVLARPKFRRYLTEEDAEQYVDLFRRGGTLAKDPPLSGGLTSDPGDDYLVALARASGATALISGDRHLTGLPNPEPPVWTARELVEHLKGRG